MKNFDIQSLSAIAKSPRARKEPQISKIGAQGLRKNLNNQKQEPKNFPNNTVQLSFGLWSICTEITSQCAGVFLDNQLTVYSVPPARVAVSDSNTGAIVTVSDMVGLVHGAEKVRTLCMDINKQKEALLWVLNNNIESQ